MDAQTERLIDLYSFVKASVELCQQEVMEAQHAKGNAEMLAIVRAISDEWGEFWTAFRARWGIPDHPFADEIMEGRDE